MDYKDYYNILGLAKSASQEEIKKAYRKLAIKYHPDKTKGDKQDEERFKEIGEAYAVLRDPQKRKKYDQMGANWKQYEQAGRAGGFDSSQFGGQSPGGSSFHFEGDMNDIFGGAAGGGFSDFFNAFFGGRGGAQSGFAGQQQRPRKGQNLHAEMEISLYEAYHGTSRMLNVDGKKLRVNIKPGTYNGQELRIKGRGGRGAGGGPDGDIYIKIKLQPDNNYKIERNNLILTTNVDLYTAVLGGKKEIQTLAGKLNVPVPQGSQSESKLRLRSKGMPVYNKPGQYGDLFVQLKVEIPKKLSEEETNLFKKLKELQSNHVYNEQL